MLRAFQEQIQSRRAQISVFIAICHIGLAAQANTPADESEVGEARGELSTTQGSTSSWRKSVETKSAYKLGSGFDSFANDREQSQFFGMAVGTDFKAQLLPALSFRSKAGATLTSGYAQSRFGDNVGRSGIWVDEAVLKLRALDSRSARIYLDAGALNQSDLGMRMLVDRQPFPGVREALVFGSKEQVQLKVWAQQTIPTSKNLSTKTVDAEVTPTFMTETIELKVRAADSVHLNGFITHFSFHNLPSAIATESQVYGNNILEAGPNTSRFKYNFEGVGAGGSANFHLTRNLDWQFGGYVVHNAQAPEGFQNAQLVRTNLTIRLPNDIDLIPAAALFFSEDDVAPGFYNDSIIGHNNRQGYSGALEVFFQQQRFKLKAEFVDAELINFNINQSRQQIFSIGFETFYEIF